MKKRLFVLLALLLGILAVSAGSSAQDIDISDMDNAQLLQLLQTIMQQLESDGTEAVSEPLPAATEMPVISVARYSDGKIFHIYENKKLILERIPDSYFFTGNGGEADETPAPGKKKDPGGPSMYATQTPGWEHDGIPEG